MDPVLLTIIVVLAAALLLVTGFMEWVGVMNIVTPRSGPRYRDCGHLKFVVTSAQPSCWHCRHARLEHALHLPVHPH